MNDPNGPLWFNGWYHIFYRHKPFGDTWADMHWGHARSRDLVNWEHLPIALAPANELGETHCFSGCAVLNNGVPAIVYTSVGGGERSAHNGAEQWPADSDDNILTWKKKPALALTNAIHTRSGLENRFLNGESTSSGRRTKRQHLVKQKVFVILLAKASVKMDNRFCKTECILTSPVNG
jgi:hypothetical protein